MPSLCDEIAKMGRGIGNPSRYRILESLMSGAKTVSEVVKVVKLTQPNVSQNLKVMKEANLVECERRGQEMYYSINVAYMASLLEKASARRRKDEKNMNTKDYTALASDEAIARTINSLRERNVEGVVVDTKEDAMNVISELIPQGASIMNGSSTTLEEIGFIEYLKSGMHPWNNLHEAIVKESNSEKQALLRKQALLADYYVGSVHAIAETGEYIVASNTSSQLPHLAYSSQNLVLIVGAQKIVPTMPDAIHRLETHVVPLEDARMKKVYGPAAGTRLSKILIVNNESPHVGRKVRIVLVKEKLGF